MGDTVYYRDNNGDIWASQRHNGLDYMTCMTSEQHPQVFDGVPKYMVLDPNPFGLTEDALLGGRTMKLEQRADKTWVATERRDNILHITQGNSQTYVYYALCEKLDRLFHEKGERIKEVV